MNDKFEANAQKVIDLVRAGHTFGEAAAKCNIRPMTVSEWRTRGRRAAREGIDDRYTWFYHESDKAKNEAALKVSDMLYHDALTPGNTNAQLAWLARQCPEDWAPQEDIEKLRCVINSLAESVKLLEKDA